MRRFAIVTVVVLSLGAAPTQRPTGTPDPAQARRIQETLLAWFECEECNGGELERVVKLGQQVVPILGATLERGPAPASRELYRRQLIDAHHDLESYARSHPQEKIELQPEEAYVATYLENYVATYKIRAAKALGAIGGSEARSALERGLRVSDRDDVKRAIQQALKKE